MMSNLTPGGTGHPSEIRQASTGQTLLRYGGGALALVGAVLVGIGAYDFFTVEGFGTPTKFWMIMAGIPALGVGLMMVNLGFARAQIRLFREAIGDAGPACRTCGRHNDTAARFCDSCGAQLG